MFKKLLSYFLIFNFTMLGNMQNVLAETEADCKSWQVWNSSQNKCVNSSEATQISGGAQACNDIADEAEKRKCLIQNASDANLASYGGEDMVARCERANSTNEEEKKKCKYLKENEAKKLSNWNKFYSITYTLGNFMIIPVLLNASENSCGSLAAKVMAFGAISAAAGEVWAFFSHRKGAKTLYESYKDKIKDGELSAAQKDAFLYLSEEQKLKAQSDRHRKTGYIAAGSLYAIAMLVEIWELIKNKGKEETCDIKQKKDGALASLTGKGFLSVAAAAGGLIQIGQVSKQFGWEWLDSRDDYIYRSEGLTTPTPTSFNKNIKKLIDSPIDYFYEQDEINSLIESNKTYSTNPKNYESEKKLFGHDLKKALSFLGNFIIENSYAGDDDGKSGKSTAVGTGVSMAGARAIPSNKGQSNPVSSEVQKQMKGSAGRLIIAASMGTLSFLVANNAEKQADAHDARAGEFDRLAGMFPSNDGDLGICKTEDRLDSTKPNCFCYIEENGVTSPNPARLKEDVCIKQLGLNKPSGKGKNYGKGGGPGNYGCMTTGGQFDQNCKCKSQKGNDGQNGCLKISKGLDVNGVFGANAGLATNAINGANAQYSGDYSGANSMTSGQLSNALEAIKKKVNEKLKAEGGTPIDFKKADNKFKSMAMDELKQLAPGALNHAAAGGLNAGSSINSLLGDKGTEKLEKKAEEFGIKDSDITFKDKGGGKNAKGKNDLGLDLGLSTDGPIDIGGPTDVMAKNYDYKNNDISSNSSESLFKMISSRYFSSGYQKLFEEKPKLEPSADPNKK